MYADYDEFLELAGDKEKVDRNSRSRQSTTFYAEFLSHTDSDSSTVYANGNKKI